MNLSFNPYQPPEELSKWPYEPPSRSSLAAAMRRFLAREISTTAFVKELDHFDECNDPIIQYVLNTLGYYCEDCASHLVLLDKNDWDCFQRLLLVLQSDCRVETKSQQRWSIRQLIAAATLCGFAYAAWKSGWGQHLLLLAIPFGVVSIALSFWRSRHPFGQNPYEQVIYPFASFSDLATAYRRSDFHKTRCPKYLGKPRKGSMIGKAAMCLQLYAVWLVASPVVLFIQMMPERYSEARIVGN